MLDRITVHGARQHNLKNIDVEIPRNTLTVITGLSGSGKSSLAFDTIYAEGQRRYVVSLSTEARAQGLCPRAHRWGSAFARRGHAARQAQESHDRSCGGRPPGKTGDREAPGGGDRDRHETRQRPGADRCGQWRGAPVLPEAGVYRMRRQYSAVGAAIVLVQQPVRSLRGMSWTGQQMDLRPGQRDCRFRQAAARWRPRPRHGFLADAAAPRGTREKEPDQPCQAVRRAEQEGARNPEGRRWRIARRTGHSGRDLSGLVRSLS